MPAGNTVPLRAFIVNLLHVVPRSKYYEYSDQCGRVVLLPLLHISEATHNTCAAAACMVCCWSYFAELCLPLIEHTNRTYINRNFVLFFFSTLGEWRTIWLRNATLPHIFIHDVLVYLNFIVDPALAGVSSSSRSSSSATCPYWRLPLLLQQRQLPLIT